MHVFCVCIHIYYSTCASVCVCVHMCAHMRTCVCARVCVHVCVFIDDRLYNKNHNMNGMYHTKYWQVKINIWQNIFGRLNRALDNITCMCMHTYMYVHTYMYTHAKLLLLTN